MDIAADSGTTGAAQIMRVTEVAMAPLPLHSQWLSCSGAEGDEELGASEDSGDDLNGVPSHLLRPSGVVSSTIAVSDEELEEIELR
uniref:Uncharacterized protein n=1 Tax=Oryza meridionalis TaxID=40149 RepID=A0A0E0E8W6_9ORYZ